MDDSTSPSTWWEQTGPFNEGRLAAEYALLQPPSAEYPPDLGASKSDSKSYADAMEECVRIAALIFNNSLLGDRPDGSALHQSLGAQIEEALRGLDVERCLLADTRDENGKGVWYSEVLLWVVFMAGLRVRGPARGTFARLVPRVCGSLGVESWEECEAVLRRFLWLERTCEKACRDMWVGSMEGREGNA